MPVTAPSKAWTSGLEGEQAACGPGLLAAGDEVAVPEDAPAAPRRGRRRPSWRGADRDRNAQHAGGSPALVEPAPRTPIGLDCSFAKLQGARGASRKTDVGTNMSATTVPLEEGARRPPPVELSSTPPAVRRPSGKTRDDRRLATRRGADELTHSGSATAERRAGCRGGGSSRAPSQCRCARRPGTPGRRLGSSPAPAARGCGRRRCRTVPAR
jgi:hypothetical protein